MAGLGLLRGCGRNVSMGLPLSLHVRQLSTSFADIYRQSTSSIPLSAGDSLVGSIVGKRKARSTSSQFSVVDFGMKSEAPFSRGEVPGKQNIGDSFARTLVELEDDFNEPSFDHDDRSNLPVTLAKRYRALTSVTSDKSHFMYGRLSGFKRGGASAKVLGFDAFVPRHHVLVLEKPAIGSFSPLYVMSLSSSVRPGGGQLPGLEVNPVVSSYGGVLFTLINLIGLDNAWEASGGGSSKDRLGYLQLLARVLYQKNAAIRSVLPKSHGGSRRYNQRNQRGRQEVAGENGMAWLDMPDFPRVYEQQQQQGGRATVGAVRGRVATSPGVQHLRRRPGAPRVRDHPTRGGTGPRGDGEKQSGGRAYPIRKYPWSE